MTIPCPRAGTSAAPAAVGVDLTRTGVAVQVEVHDRCRLGELREVLVGAGCDQHQDRLHVTLVIGESGNWSLMASL